MSKRNFTFQRMFILVSESNLSILNKKTTVQLNYLLLKNEFFTAHFYSSNKILFYRSNNYSTAQIIISQKQLGREMILFEYTLTMSFLEAARTAVKIGSSLKSNHHREI